MTDDDAPPPTSRSVLDAESDRLAWRLAVDAAGVGAFVWDLVTGDLRWDERLHELFGLDEESFGGTIEAFNRCVHPDDVGRVSDALQRAIATCGDYDSEYRVVLPDGTVRWIEARGHAFADHPDGPPVRLVGAAYDTTQVREGEARMGRVLESMSSAFFQLDHAWRFSLRQLRGRAAAGRDARPPDRRQHLGVVPRGRGQHVRGALPGRRRVGRAGDLRGLVPAAAGRLVRGARLALPRGPGRLLRRHHRPPRRAGGAGPLRPPPRTAGVGVGGPHRDARPHRGRQPAGHPPRARARRLVPGDPRRGPARRRLATRAARRRLVAPRPRHGGGPARLRRPTAARDDRQLLPRPGDPRDDAGADGVLCVGGGGGGAGARHGARPAAQPGALLGRGRPAAGPRPDGRGGQRLPRHPPHPVHHRRRVPPRGHRRPRCAGARQRPPLRVAARRLRGPAAQHAHRTAAAPRTAGRDPLHPRRRGGPHRRGLVRRLPAGRRHSPDTRHRGRRRRRRRPRRGGGGRDGAGARPAARHRRAQRRRARRDPVRPRHGHAVAAARDHRHRGRGPLRAGHPGQQRRGPGPAALVARGAPAGAARRPRRDRDPARGRRRQRPAARLRPRSRPPRRRGGAGGRRDPRALHRRARRAP